MRMRAAKALAGLVISALLGIAPLQAQGPLVRSDLRPASAHFRVSDSERARTETPHSLAGIQKTEWLKGGIIGAVIAGLATAYLAGGLCDSDAGGGCHSSQVVAAAALGAAAGFTIGALIGGSIAKDN